MPEKVLEMIATAGRMMAGEYMLGTRNPWTGVLLGKQEMSLDVELTWTIVLCLIF